MQELFEKLYPEYLQNSGYSSEIFHADRDGSFDNLPDFPANAQELYQIHHVLNTLNMALIPNEPVTVILAAGKGSRMNNGIRQKALAPIHGRPAIIHALETCKANGLKNYLFVIGIGYKEMIHSILQYGFSGSFLFQESQLGTGHAARLAGRYLQHHDYQGDILITMGDKYITARGLKQILQIHDQSFPDLTLATASKTAWPDNGRILLDDNGHVHAIIEKADIVSKRIVSEFIEWPDDPVTSAPFIKRALTIWNREEKLRKILGAPFWEALHTCDTLSKTHGLKLLRDREPNFLIPDFPPLSGQDTEERCTQVNVSLYYFKSQAYYDSLESLQPNNAQGELYLTDAVEYLVDHKNGPVSYKVVNSQLPDDYDIMGFNTVEELQQIEEKVKLEMDSFLNCPVNSDPMFL